MNANRPTSTRLADAAFRLMQRGDNPAFLAAMAIVAGAATVFVATRAAERPM